MIARATVCALLAAGTTIAMVSCASLTENCASPTNVTGTWRYGATQETPQRAALTGTLTVDRQSCTEFSGALDVIEVDAEGTSRRMAGAVSGRLLDATSLQFDVMLGAESWQHVGTLGGDSLEGSWVEVSGNDVTGTGEFESTREVTR
jgi:hypothetical protein